MSGAPSQVAWDGEVIATTERLTLRTFRIVDLPAYAALNAHRAVYEALSGKPISRQGSDEMAAWAQRLFAVEGIGLLAVERHADGAFLGMCGLHHQESYPDDVEVAWRFAPEHWGQGYAPEAAAAWLRLGFDSHGFPRIISMTDRDNVRSLGVMQRLGMRYDHSAVIVDEDIEFEALVYSLTAEQWRSVASGAP